MDLKRCLFFSKAFLIMIRCFVFRDCGRLNQHPPIFNLRVSNSHIHPVEIEDVQEKKGSKLLVFLLSVYASVLKIMLWLNFGTEYLTSWIPALITRCSQDGLWNIASATTHKKSQYYSTIHCVMNTPIDT